MRAGIGSRPPSHEHRMEAGVDAAAEQRLAGEDQGRLDLVGRATAGAVENGHVQVGHRQVFDQLPVSGQAVVEPPGVLRGQLELLGVDFDAEVVAVVRIGHVRSSVKVTVRLARAPVRFGIVGTELCRRVGGSEMHMQCQPHPGMPR